MLKNGCGHGDDMLQVLITSAGQSDWCWFWTKVVVGQSDWC